MRYYVVRIYRHETSITTSVKTIDLFAELRFSHHYLILDWIPLTNSLAPTQVSSKFNTFAPVCRICMFMLMLTIPVDIVVI